MRVLDLFSGIGGFSLGLERAGMQTVAFCEIDPYCRRVLAKHWPNVPIFEDVRTLRGIDVEAVDVICGGFPCQDISTAGKGAGLAGERSGLWSEYARLVGEVRPRFIVVENVAALLGRGMGVVLGRLAALGMRVWWDCIPAAAVGAPHIRDRIWIVAYPGSEQYQGFGDALRWSIAAQLSQANVADADCGRGSKRQQAAAPMGYGNPARAASGNGGDADGSGLSIAGTESSGTHRVEGGRMPSPADWWATEPDVGRVAHGVPSRVDRLRGLGNAVVPQIPEIIGRAILRAEQGE